MSNAKKSAGKSGGKPTKASDRALPDPRAMESFLAAVSGLRDDAIMRAQDVIYDAWDSTTSRSRVALARKALGISPLCADAFNLLAEEAASAAEARDLYERGLKAGELALGPEGFKEFDGEFWGFLETRPYMRALHGLALTLLELGDEAAAIDHFRAMLKLNPNDNQGIRYLLLATLLRRDEHEAMKALLADYPDEGGVQWLYTLALLAYRENRAGETATAKLLKEARAANEHVPGILAGTEPEAPPKGGFITVGGPDEATDYVREYGAAWRSTPGAIDWLTGGMAAAAAARPKRRRSKP